MFKLIGKPKRPRDAIGAKVFVTRASFGNVEMFSVAEATGRILIRGCISVWLQRASAAKVDKVEIVWPSGKKQEITPLGIDQMFTVDEIKGLK